MTSSGSSSLPLRCKCRRKAVTSLRCARCSVPICPDCSIVAPAGMLCRECASSRRSPLFQVSAGSLALAFVVTLAVASVAGWLLAGFAMSFGFFLLWIGYLYGLGVAEVALRVTGRKRGLQMEILAAVCAVLGIVIGWLPGAFSHGIDVTSILLLHLSRIWTYVLLGLAVFGAINRIRSI